MAEQIDLADPPARPRRRLADFHDTKQHRRFVEFADAVRRHRYIGACYGAPGLGKTLSARTYAAADDWERWANRRYTRETTLPAGLLANRTLFYTAPVAITARRLLLEIEIRASVLGGDIDRTLDPNHDPEFDDHKLEIDCSTELVIVDEADRLKTTGLEQLRDFFDRHDLGLILIGMPGFDRQLARYPQLYSRIGFAHQYRPLDIDELPGVLGHYWHQVGIPFDPDDNNLHAVAAINRTTGGNFRLIERLMAQIARILEINQLDTITPDVVDAARQMLVVGTT